MQKPYGKEINISFIGSKPYITKDSIGGSEFLIVKMLAEKYKFIPKFIPERSFDNAKHNGTLSGMLHRVRLINTCKRQVKT